MYEASFKGTFAYGFHNKSACYVVAFCNHVKMVCARILKECVRHCQIVGRWDIEIVPVR